MRVPVISFNTCRFVVVAARCDAKNIMLDQGTKTMLMFSGKMKNIRMNLAPNNFKKDFHYFNCEKLQILFLKM